MSNTTGLPPDPNQYPNIKKWAEDLIKFMTVSPPIRQRTDPQAVQLAHQVSGGNAGVARASSDGVLMFDPQGPNVVVSIAGAWEALGGAAPPPDLSNYYTKTQADAAFLSPAEGNALFLDQSEGDARYGRLGAANTWTQQNTFSTTVIDSTGSYPLIVRYGGSNGLVVQSNGRVWGAGVCTNSNDFTPKSYVDSAVSGRLTQSTADGRYVNKSGDSMSGGLDFGSSTVSSDVDVSRHLALYGNSYGLCVTGSTLNLVANGNVLTHENFYSCNTTATSFDSTAGRLGVRLSYDSNGGTVWVRTNGGGSTGANALLVTQGAASSAVMNVKIGGGINNTTGSVGSISDARLKQNVNDIGPQLADFMKLRVVNYELIAQPEAGKLAGFIAQELREVKPGLVGEDDTSDDPMLYVKLLPMVPLLVKALQEATARIEALETAMNPEG